MATGDLKNNLRKLHCHVRKISYPHDLDLEGLAVGKAVAYLPIYHFLFLEYSKQFCKHLVQMKFDMFARSDMKFMQAMLKVLREMFSYRPAITKEQFFSGGFAEVKMLMCMQIIDLVIDRHRDLTRGCGLKTETKRPGVNSSIATSDGSVSSRSSISAVAVAEKPESITSGQSGEKDSIASINRRLDAPLHEKSSSRKNTASRLHTRNEFEHSNEKSGRLTDYDRHMIHDSGYGSLSNVEQRRRCASDNARPRSKSLSRNEDMISTSDRYPSLTSRPSTDQNKLKQVLVHRELEGGDNDCEYQENSMVINGMPMESNSARGDSHSDDYVLRLLSSISQTMSQLVSRMDGMADRIERLETALSQSESSSRQQNVDDDTHNSQPCSKSNKISVEGNDALLRTVNNLTARLTLLENSVTMLDKQSGGGGINGNTSHAMYQHLDTSQEPSMPPSYPSPMKRSYVAKAYTSEAADNASPSLSVSDVGSKLSSPRGSDGSSANSRLGGMIGGGGMNGVRGEGMTGGGAYAWVQSHTRVGTETAARLDSEASLHYGSGCRTVPLNPALSRNLASSEVTRTENRMSDNLMSNTVEKSAVNSINEVGRVYGGGVNALGGGNVGEGNSLGGGRVNTLGGGLVGVHNDSASSRSDDSGHLAARTGSRNGSEDGGSVVSAFSRSSTQSQADRIRAILHNTESILQTRPKTLVSPLFETASTRTQHLN